MQLRGVTRPSPFRWALGLVPSLLVVSLLLGACAGPGSRSGAPGPEDARAAATAEAAGTALLGPARQLTFAGQRSGEGYWNRDGTQLVFQSEREPGNPFYQIYWMDRQAGRVERVSPGFGKTTCGWIHPSGERILFASTHLDPESRALQQAELDARAAASGGRHYAWDFDPHFDLFSVPVPGDDALGHTPSGKPRQLTDTPGYDAEASWSPDGRQIVFASNRHIYAADGSLSDLLTAEERARAETDPSSFVDLYLMDARSGHVQRLTIDPGYDGGPFFSPDGKRIVFRRFSMDGATAEIFTMRTDGSDVVQLTRLGAMSWAPFYHPSGDYVIFATNLHGFANFELYVVRTDGEGEPVRVTSQDGFDGLPAFSPDGEQLAFTRKPPGGTSQLYVAAFDDAATRKRLGLASQSFHGVGPLLPLPTRLSADITPDDLRAYVEALASEPTAGRMTGTAGERIATSYVARSFRAMGLAPAGDAEGYFQAFGFTAGVSLGPANRLQATDPGGAPVVIGKAGEPRVDVDFRPLAFSHVGSIPASEIIFVGHGIVAPELAPTAGESDAPVPARDAYADTDVEGKWVLALRFLPEDLSPDARRHYGRYASLRYKAMVARDRGARGILFVSGPGSGVERQLVKLSSDASLAGTSIAVVSLTDAAADALLRAGGAPTLAALTGGFAAGAPRRGIALEGVLLEANIDIRQQRKKGRNVLSRLPAARPAEPPLPALVIGAHLDHLGVAAGAGSLARDEERDAIHPGADDNASGVAALLEIAGRFADARARGADATVRDIVFAAWSGEELGLLGSSAFADNEERTGALPTHVAAYLNMDMVGRLRGDLALFGVDSSPVWPREIERRNAPIGLRISAHGDSYLPTDATTFYLRGVPALSAFTGAHDEYHTPRDTPETLDYDGLAEIARLMGAIAGALAQDPSAPPFVSSPAPAQGVPRAGLRVYLGTIPDYTQKQVVRGVALSGVSKGGPAERAGLLAGDIIVSVDGHKIENIYDYTYALDGLKVGVDVEVVVLRAESEATFTLTPGSRE